MVIDCHGHYTTTPAGVADWRDAQTAAVARDPAFVGSKGSMRVTDDEIRDFLDAGKSLQLATINKDGTPHLVTMWYGLIDGKIVLETFEKSQKAVNLKRDPRLACLLESGTEYNQLKGIQINGTAKLVTDKAEILDVMKAVLGRNHEMDEKTLETALSVLESLQAGGRQVGIISHVQKLAENIGAQIIVQPESPGLSRVVVAGPGYS